jgi:hypothetical protein
LPEKPAELFQPVPIPPLKRGEDARVGLAKTRDALKSANGRIEQGGDWYDQVRERAATGG